MQNKFTQIKRAKNVYKRKRAKISLPKNTCKINLPKKTSKICFPNNTSKKSARRLHQYIENDISYNFV